MAAGSTETHCSPQAACDELQDPVDPEAVRAGMQAMFGQDEMTWEVFCDVWEALPDAMDDGWSAHATQTPPTIHPLVSTLLRLGARCGNANVGSLACIASGDTFPSIAWRLHMAGGRGVLDGEDLIPATWHGVNMTPLPAVQPNTPGGTWDAVAAAKSLVHCPQAGGVQGEDMVSLTTTLQAEEGDEKVAPPPHTHAQVAASAGQGDGAWAVRTGPVSGGQQHLVSPWHDIPLLVSANTLPQASPLQPTRRNLHRTGTGA